MPAPDKIDINPANLKRSRLFAGLSDEQLQELLGFARIGQWPRGGRIITAGEPNGAFYFIEQGGVDIFKQVVSREGEHEVKIASLQVGHTFGEMALLDPHPCPASAIANSDSVVLAFDHSDLAKLDPSIYTTLLVNLTREVSRRLRTSDQYFAASIFSHR